MTFDPDTCLRSTLQLEWRRFHRIVSDSRSPAAFDWLEFIIDGEPLSAILAGTAGSQQDPRSAGSRPGPAGISTLQDRPGNTGNPAWDAARLELLLTGWSQTGINPTTVPLKSGRVPLYICPECGDYGCGTTCVRVERVNAETIVWHEFRDESDLFIARHADLADLYHDNAAEWAGVGPFYFDYAQYTSCLREFPAKPATVEFL